MTASYTTARAAQIAGVSRPTISAALKSGDLRGNMSNRNRWSIADPDLRDWMSRRVERAAPDPIPVPLPEPAPELVARIEAAEAAAAAAEARALVAEGRAQEASAAAERAGEKASAAEARAAVAEAAVAAAERARDAAAAEAARLRSRGWWERLLNRT